MYLLLLKQKLKQLTKKLKNDDNSKTSALQTKDSTRLTELTVDNHQLTDRVLVRNTSNLGITERNREEYPSNNLEKNKKSETSKKLSEVISF